MRSILRGTAAATLALAIGAAPVFAANAGAKPGDSTIVEIVAVLALLGWLNRWCQALAPQLEPDAAAFAAKHLAPSGWRAPQN